MFNDSVLAEDKALLEIWRKRCNELYGDREFNAATDSGIEIKPLYTPADIERMEYKDIGLPGEYPLTRGPRPLMYQVEPWMLRTGYGYGTGEESRCRREFLAMIGVTEGASVDRPTHFTMALDLPTQRGYDADDPVARGRVGRDGMSISTIRDLEALFEGVPLDEVFTMFIAHDTSMACIAMYIVYAERQGVPPNKLRMKGCHPIYRWWGDQVGYPPKSAMKLMVELIKYSIQHMPLMMPQAIIGYNVGEAGGTAVQEVAFTLATAIAITDECIKAGLDPDDVVPRLYSHDHINMDFFEAIAKFRAKRRMWAKIFKERFGCQKPESLILTYIPQTGGSLLTAQEPFNNIIRATLMTLAGVLAGVDAIWTTHYDEGHGIPTDQSALIQARTQQVIYHETNIPSITDPLGGSYYVEWLTNKIEDEAYKLLQKIEDLGGYIKSWEEGWFRRELEISAFERERKMVSGERVVVGVNKYRLPEQPKIETFKFDTKIEEELIARVRKFKADRDSSKLPPALAELRAAAHKLNEGWPGSCGCLMPAIIDAFRADATLGEVQQVMREVFGYGYVY